jgi:hypothetical protein
MRKPLAALLAALMLAGSLPAAARGHGFEQRGMHFRNQGFDHRGMRFRNQDRDRFLRDRFLRDRFVRDRFFHRSHSRFFLGGGALFVPAPVYVNPYPAPQYYWYCANPPGYYPAVAQCFTAWQAVPVP